MGMLSFLSALLAVVPAAAMPPASAEPDVWALVARVNSASAYALYLERFPQGPHQAEAREAYSRRQVGPALDSPAPPLPVVTILPPAPDACGSLLSGLDPTAGSSEEARAFKEAQRSNRPGDFRTYLSTFPNGACGERAARILEARAARAARFKPVPGLGPLAPHPLRSQIFDDEDYPASAVRNGETGNVGAEWEVAEDGLVEGCRVARSSGSMALDTTTCRLITTRLRYDPARDSLGATTRAADRGSINWMLPAD